MTLSPMIMAAIVMMAASVAPTLSLADDLLHEVDAPPPRPYPYELLGLRPGDPLADVAALFSRRSIEEPSSTELRLRVQSPSGKVVEFSYEAERSIGDIGFQVVLII